MESKSNSLYQNLLSLFSIEFTRRVIAAVIFVSVFFYSIFDGGFLLFILFIIFFIIILSELIKIYFLSSNKINVIFYSIIASFSLILFPYYFFTLEDKYFISLYIIVSIWAFDTFSYLFGNIFKGKKIFPRISKGKTYSGLFSGFTLVLVLSAILSYFLYEKVQLYLIIFSILICSLSFIGDTYVSVLKRQSNIKDSGTLFIGHGGFLDRMDSFIMVMFFFILFDLQKFLIYV